MYIVYSSDLTYFIKSITYLYFTLLLISPFLRLSLMIFSVNYQMYSRTSYFIDNIINRNINYNNIYNYNIISYVIIFFLYTSMILFGISINNNTYFISQIGFSLCWQNIIRLIALGTIRYVISLLL